MNQPIARLPLHLVSLLAAGVLLGCSKAPATTATTPPQTTASSTAQTATSMPSAVTPTAVAQATPSVFTSTQYGYSVVLPAGWSSIAATERWDGVSITASDSPNVDQFYATGLASSWASAAAYTGTLKSYAAKAIADTAKYHGDKCTAPPEANLATTIGGEPGTLVQFNCGILINIAVTVHDGSGYTFGFRDPTVQVAADPADQAIFTGILASAQFLK